MTTKLAKLCTAARALRVRNAEMVLINIRVDNLRDTDGPSPVFLDARVHGKLNLYARYNYSSVAEL